MIELGFVVPGLPHPLLCPGDNPGWQSIRDGFEALRAEIEASRADVLVLYSTMWPSVIGHQVQADPEPEWVHVDELFHDLGSIPYRFRMDTDLAAAVVSAAKGRGLQAREVAYHGFPIDTGSVVALSLLTPDNRIPAIIISSNVYSDLAETKVLAKAVRDGLAATGRTAAVGVVTTLSNRLFTEFIDPADDHIHSPKDAEWNDKVLEFLAAGRLEDTAQLSREIHRQVRVHKVVNFKPLWFLSGVMGEHNRYRGKVHAYAPIVGTGSAVVRLSPSDDGVMREFDEDDVEVFAGDREVLDAAPVSEPSPSAASAATAGAVSTDAAPAPVGAYPHARRVGDLLYLSGVGPRQPKTNDIPGGPVRNETGPLDYDMAAQTEAVIDNVRRILEAAGSALDRVVDITVFLIDMDRDFATYNEIYARHFGSVQATRTTLAVSALPTPIAIEFKVIARA